MDCVIKHGCHQNIQSSFTCDFLLARPFGKPGFGVKALWPDSSSMLARSWIPQRRARSLLPGRFMILSSAKKTKKGGAPLPTAIVLENVLRSAAIAPCHNTFVQLENKILKKFIPECHFRNCNHSTLRYNGTVAKAALVNKRLIVFRAETLSRQMILCGFTAVSPQNYTPRRVTSLRAWLISIGGCDKCELPLRAKVTNQPPSN